MKFVSDIRLLLLSVWLGSSVFFIAAAQGAFAVLEQHRELAGAIVGRNLTILNFGGLVIAAVLILTSFVAVGNANRITLWAERFMLLVVAGACAIGQFVIGFWMSMLRGQMGRPIEEIAADDPLRVQFNNLHNWSEWTLMVAMFAALVAFFLIANRKPGIAVGSTATTTNDPFDFSKEFKKT